MAFYEHDENQASSWGETRLWSQTAFTPLAPLPPLAQAKLPLQVETIAPTPEAFVRSKWFHDKMV